MTRAGKSIFYFGFWVLACGISLMFFPKLCLDTVGIHLSDYITVRLFGMVLIYLSIYYFVSGRHPAFHPLYRIGFVIVDALGALWTWLALRNDRKEGLI
jgi:hypothetical protein